MKKIFSILYKLKISDLLVEAGGGLFANLIKEKLVDELHLFKAPFNIGNKGIPLLNGLELKKINIFIDLSLSRYENIYAAAGHPHTIFKITYKQLLKITNGKEKNIV